MFSVVGEDVEVGAGPGVGVGALVVILVVVLISKEVLATSIDIWHVIIGRLLFLGAIAGMSSLVGEGDMCSVVVAGVCGDVYGLPSLAAAVAAGTHDGGWYGLPVGVSAVLSFMPSALLSLL